MDALASACTTLKCLDIGRNGLGNLPAELGRFSTLEKLWCEDNVFETVPGAILELRNLKSLKISNNRIAQIPANMETKLPKLEELYFDCNSLSALPEDLSPALRVLSVRGNRIRRIGKLPSTLKTLACSSNAIEAISDETIASMPGVEKVYLNSNKLVGLNPAFAKLEKLVLLNVSCNQIGSLAESMQPWAGEDGVTELRDGALSVKMVGNPLFAKRSKMSDGRNKRKHGEDVAK